MSSNREINVQKELRITLALKTTKNKEKKFLNALVLMSMRKLNGCFLVIPTCLSFKHLKFNLSHTKFVIFYTLLCVPILVKNSIAHQARLND